MITDSYLAHVNSQLKFWTKALDRSKLYGYDDLLTSGLEPWARTNLELAVDEAEQFLLPISPYLQRRLHAKR